MKNTYASLSYRLKTISILLDRPTFKFASEPGECTRFTVGYLDLFQTAQGYQVEEQISEVGATTYWSEVLTASQMGVYLSGVLNGISLSKVAK